jgi:hypothetical protein
MKKIFALTLYILLFISQTFAQSPPKNNGVAEGIGAVAGISAAFIGAAITIDILKENLEDEACKYVFRELPDYTNFSLKILEFNATKLSDLSGVSVIPFALQKYGSPKEVILMVTDPGWVNDYGLNINHILFYKYNISSWDSLITKFLYLASPCKISDRIIPLYKRITVNISSRKQDGDEIIETMFKSNILYWVKSSESTIDSIYRFDQEGIQCVGGNELVFPFDVLDGDYHISYKYNQDMILDYNEKTLNIYFMQLDRIVKLSLSSISSIHKFLHSIPDKYSETPYLIKP